MPLNCPDCGRGFFRKENAPDCSCQEMVKVQLTFPDGSIDDWNAAKEENEEKLVTSLAADLNVTEDRITNLTVVAGSVVVNFVLLPPQGVETFEAAVAESLVSQLESGNLTTLAAELSDFGTPTVEAETPAELQADPVSPPPPPLAGEDSGGSSSDSDSTLPMIIGIVVGVVVLLGGAGGFFYWRRQNMRTGPAGSALPAPSSSTEEV